MTLPKPAAALSANLLVAKGAAAPMAFIAGRGWTKPAALTWPSREQTRAADVRAKLSLRLDPELHLRLKVVAAHLKRSRQDVLTTALEQYIERLGPELASGCLCTRPGAPTSPGGRL